MLDAGPSETGLASGGQSGVRNQSGMTPNTSIFDYGLSGWLEPTRVLCGQNSTVRLLPPRTTASASVFPRVLQLLKKDQIYSRGRKKHRYYRTAPGGFQRQGTAGAIVDTAIGDGSHRRRGQDQVAWVRRTVLGHHGSRTARLSVPRRLPRIGSSVEPCWFGYHPAITRWTGRSR